MAKTKNTKPSPLSNLEYLNQKKKIWLNPEYQRESVWTLSQKQLLIDSLLQDIDVPKLYFREINKAPFELEVVDGQQRLRAVFDFFTDVFRMPSDSDPVEEHETRGRFFSQLHLDLQMKLRNALFDVVTLSAGYSDDDVEEIFLRLQNGTPLNAAEKRRAVAGNMRAVVRGLATHRLFKHCGFRNTRYAYEDSAAKVLHLLINGSITDIRPLSLKRTYETHQAITDGHSAVKAASRVFEFLSKAFSSGASPKFKKYAVITLSFLVAELLEKYDLSNHHKAFAKSYLKFETRRVRNEELSEEDQDTKLAAFTNAARSDSIQDMNYRHELLRDELLRGIPALQRKDDIRVFSDEQRMAIFVRDGGKCQKCGDTCKQDHYHADHIVAHSKGGKTMLENGQLLCPDCNLKKHAKEN